MSLSRPLRVFSRCYMTLIFTLLYVPILVLIGISFNDSRNPFLWGGFSLRWYDKLLGNANLMDAALNTLWLGVTAATLATLIGTLTATALYRYRFRGKPLLNGMLFTVMMMPDIVMAIAFLALFIALGIQLGYFSLLVSHATFCLPFVVITVYSRLSGINPQLLEAARDLGASEARAVWHVLVPALMPAIASGWLLSFTLSLDDVVISTFVTGPTFEVLPLRIYSMVRLGLKPEVNALATLLLGLSLCLLVISQWLIKEKK